MRHQVIGAGVAVRCVSEYVVGGGGETVCQKVIRDVLVSGIGIQKNLIPKVVIVFMLSRFHPQSIASIPTVSLFTWQLDLAELYFSCI